jgi:hypothetical protein
MNEGGGIDALTSAMNRRIWLAEINANDITNGVGSTKIPNFEAYDGPSLGVVAAKSDGDDFSDGGGDLCLTWNGGKGTIYWSLFPWTHSHEVPKINISGRPAVCQSNSPMVLAWKDGGGTGISSCGVDPASPAGSVLASAIPNHAHTDSSPAIVPGEQGYTILWTGDHEDGGNGTEKKLWSMSYGVYGWQAPVEVPGAKPKGSPTAFLGDPPVYESWLTTYAAWADSSGQIWWSQWNGSTGLPGLWTQAVLGPTSFTNLSPAIAVFNATIVVAWVLPGSGWIMVSTLTAGDSSDTWTNPARVPGVATQNAVAMAVWKGKLYMAWRGHTTDSLYYEVFGSVNDLPQPTHKKSFLIPIINIYTTGQYTASVLVGSQQDQANVIVDTGSSTLAVLPSKYKASHDTDLSKTSLAQRDQYGAHGATGWWYGPVVETRLAVPAVDGPSLVVNQNTTSIGIAVGNAASPRPIFRNADGIMGLAYSNLNKGFDLSSYLTAHGHSSKTYPWVLAKGTTSADLTSFNAVASSSDVTTQDVPPVFTQLEQEGLLPNKFALWTHRALVSFYQTDITSDPRNNGYLVLGGGESWTDLYLGSFQTVAVLDDKFYYVNLVEVQVGNNAPIPVSSSNPVPEQAANALVDSGTSQIVLEQSLFLQVIAQFKAINSAFPSQVGFFPGLPFSQVDIGSYPVLRFTFTGSDGSNVVLLCTPGVYWQVDSPAKGYVTCTLQQGPLGNPSIMGLTLLNQYYTIFDRSVGGNGVIKFAEKILYYE